MKRSIFFQNCNLGFFVSEEGRFFRKVGHQLFDEESSPCDDDQSGHDSDDGVWSSHESDDDDQICHESDEDDLYIHNRKEKCMVMELLSF